MRVITSRPCSSFSIKRVVEHYNNRSSQVNVPITDDRPFRMVLPPPNVTGNLHLGHALTVVMEDSVCRYQHRLGRDVQWIPGFDHAGIATQVVVERQVFKELGLRRLEMPAEEFLQHCRQWKDARIVNISNQLRRTGAHLNWEMPFYTMDEPFCNAVREAFCRLHSDGLIFRDLRMINWCPTLHSAVSDQEVDKVVIDGKEVAVCSRTGDVIEPRLREQWFLNCHEINADVLKSVERGEIRIYPEGNTQKLINWLNDSEPWCLSRQLVWGHRIPAYKNSNGDWLVSANSHPELEQDPDVLDTWFSSSLIPLAVRGWPDNFNYNETPINLMETGHDIIGFWVARMLTVCKHLTKTLPFKNVLLHGLIRDAAGRKMSKSLGNVVDPLDIIDGISLHDMQKRLDSSNLSTDEIDIAKMDMAKRYSHGIPESGPDALRFAMLRHDLLAEDINMSVVDFAIEGSKFSNKLWNLLNYCNIAFSKTERLNMESNNIVDLWILSRLKGVLDRIHVLMDADEDCAIAMPHLAFTTLRNFILQDLCDVYLETTKSAINATTEHDLVRIHEISNTLHQIMCLLAASLEPYLPFIATFIGDHIPQSRFNDLNVLEESKKLQVNLDIETQMNFTMAIVSAVRSLRGRLNIPKRFGLFTYIENMDLRPIESVIMDLVNIDLAKNPIDGGLPVAIPASDSVLYVQIEESLKHDVVLRANEQLQKALTRKQKYHDQVIRDKEFLDSLRDNPDARKTAVKIAKKRIVQAKSNFASAQTTTKRLEKVLAEVSSL